MTMNVLEKLNCRVKELSNAEGEVRFVQVECRPDSYSKLFRLIELGQQMQWVSVDERLPDQYVDCLVYHKDHLCYNIYIGCVVDGRFSIHGFDGHSNITHWMPLPEPPKDGDNNG